MKTTKHVSGIILSVVFLFAGCAKYDDSDLWNEVNEQAARLAALEQWQQTVNGNISALQELVTVLGNNDYVTGVVAFDTPAPGGYRVTFTKSGEATIWNGAKGDKGETGATGHSPAVGVGEHPAGSGVYYWTLDGDFMTDDGLPTGNKMPVRGEKGEQGEQGISGNTPKVIIGDDNYWYYSADGSAVGPAPGLSWISTYVKATGDKGDTGATGPVGPQGDAIFSGTPKDRGDYWEFTLADDGGVISLPKYKAVGISFTQPELFFPGQESRIVYTSTGNTAPTTIRIVGLPAGWKYSVDYENTVISITPPTLGNVTDDNASGEATVQVGDDSQVIYSYWLTVTIPADARNEVGGIYYQNGIPTGMVYIVNDGNPGTGRAISLENGVAKTWYYEGSALNYTLIGGTSSTDGRANMGVIAAYIADKGTEWIYFGAFNWAHTMNGDAAVYSSGAVGLWYLPSVGEWQHFLCAATGHPLETWVFEGSDNPNREYPSFKMTYDDMANFNGLLESAGGMVLSSADPYWSSVEATADLAYYLSFNTGGMHGRNKGSQHNARAIVAF